MHLRDFLSFKYFLHIGTSTDNLQDFATFTEFPAV